MGYDRKKLQLGFYLFLLDHHKEWKKRWQAIKIVLLCQAYIKRALSEEHELLYTLFSEEEKYLIIDAFGFGKPIGKRSFTKHEKGSLINHCKLSS